METIRAANNLVIELGRGLWQLSNGMSRERPLLIATLGAAALAYRPAFAEARQLPANGGLPVKEVEEVVVGWSLIDRAWHLGFLLGPTTAAARGGRWCELAHWPDDYALLSAHEAERAGAALAEVLQCRFRFVEAPHMAPTTGPLHPDMLKAYVPPPVAVAAASSVQMASAQMGEANSDDQDWMKSSIPRLVGLRQRLAESEASTVSARSPELEAEILRLQNDPAFAAMLSSLVSPSDSAAGDIPIDDSPTPVVRVSRKLAPAITLPLALGHWHLKEISGGLKLERAGFWSLGTIGSVLFRLLLGTAFIILSVLTLQSVYAPVQPAFLPFIGLALGIGLIILGARLFLQMFRSKYVVIDRTDRQVRRHLDLTSDVRETYPFSNIRAVVVTQVARQKRRGRNGQPDRMLHEAWLHMLLNEREQPFGKERHLRPEDFYTTLAHIEQTEGDVVEAHFEEARQSKAPRPLYADEATTPAQQAGIAIAQAIGTRAYIDQR